MHKTLHQKRLNRVFILISLGPAALCFLVMFVYPLIRTVLMSLHQLPSISSSLSQWEFVGLQNYQELFKNGVFLSSLKNIGLIWLVGGILTLAIALFFAVILASGVKGKRFWRSAIYLPNIISAVALATMWIQYIFQNQFGFLKTFFEFLGLDSLAAINWTSPAYLFWAMLISYVYGCVGYFMLIFLSGVEGIPRDIYDSAEIDGATGVTKFWKITFPMLRNVIRTCITLWTVSSVNFFVWAKMFSSKINVKTVTPVYYLYEKVFGSADAGTMLDVGAGASVGVVVAVLVLICYFVMNRVFKEEDLEY